MYNQETPLITIETLCEQLMIGRSNAYKLLSSGEIKCFKINRVWKIPQKSVDEYIKTKCDSIK